MTNETTGAGPSAAPTPPAKTPGERLHKFLASTGAGSRRECETFVEQGRVSVNGKVVTKLGTKVDPTTDVVMLDGEKVQPEDKVYYLLHKPTGVVSTSRDERGRARVVDLVRDADHRVYTVGRLDVDSTGLILLTNDGAIANVVCHPRYRVEKTYQVVVRGEVSRELLTQIEAGVWLAEGKASPARVRPVARNPKRNETLLEITLFEGRNREVRRVFARVGLPVRRLVRTRIGPLQLGALPIGQFVKLEKKDLGFVREAEALYLANKEAWDAELPKPEPRARRPFRPRGAQKKGKGFPRGAGGGRPPRGPRREGSFGGGGPRRPGGFGGGRPDGGPGGGGRPFPPRGPRFGGGGGGGGGGGWRGPRRPYGPPRGPGGPGGGGRPYPPRGPGPSEGPPPRRTYE
jgi:23S rRNA pseudouridine2605 synthase